jgi:ammonium transporter, Amt family
MIMGGLSWFGLKGVGLEANPDCAGSIPHQLFMICQAMFAIITPALISGAIVERIRFRACVVFIVLWSTLSYDLVSGLRSQEEHEYEGLDVTEHGERAYHENI